MSFEFTNSIDDYIKAYDYIDRHKPDRYFKFYIVPRIIAPLFQLLCIIYAFVNYDFYQVIRSTIIGFIGLVIIFIALKTYYKNRNKQISDWKIDKPYLFDKKTITLNINTLTYIDKHQTREIELSLFDKVVEEDSLIYIFGSNYNLYLVIPKNTFNDFSEQTLFINKIKGLNN
ncbi:YcxB family protein [Romboutsia sp. 1001713B170131_170501_G6]|uniref:YcxB family protein n=1 Tax=Romboutsia sp. 1001713B170131_170501_G6 TaxID=2787108 RepID=UPI0018AB775E|nr:YcxB family protein [Romboutsia sp. 1001713B170131_170501_G6]